MNLDNFDWGPTSEGFKTQVIKEIFENNDYEYCFEVEENDIVVDIGATIGEFTYKILEKKPKHCYVVEPLPVFFDTLKKNLEGNQVSDILVDKLVQNYYRNLEQRQQGD